MTWPGLALSINRMVSACVHQASLNSPRAEGGGEPTEVTWAKISLVSDWTGKTFMFVLTVDFCCGFPQFVQFPGRRTPLVDR